MGIWCSRFKYESIIGNGTGIRVENIRTIKNGISRTLHKQ